MAQVKKEDIVVLKLSRNWVGQIVDGLDVLAEQWEATQRYLETGLVDDSVAIRECDDADEAASLAAWYREIMLSITEQARL